MRGIIIVSSTSSVVFHTAPFSRDVVDNVVAVVESDIQVRATSDGASATSSSSSGQERAGAVIHSETKRSRAGRIPAPAFQSTLRKASMHRHGGQDLTHMAQWLEADHKRLCEGLMCIFPAEHAWLASLLREDGDECAVILWRKCLDRVVIFVLDPEEPLSLARNAMSNFIILLCEAFDKTGSDSLPSLKDVVSRPDIVQACCSCVAPQHVLAWAPLVICRQMLQRLLPKR